MPVKSPLDAGHGRAGGLALAAGLCSALRLQWWEHLAGLATSGRMASFLPQHWRPVSIGIATVRRSCDYTARRQNEVLDVDLRG